MARRRQGRRIGSLSVVGAIALLLALLAPVPSARATYPTLPAIDGSRAVSNISSPVVAPGDGGSILLDVADPLSVPIAGAVLSAEVYEFNAYPGNATGPPGPGSLSLGGGPTFAWEENVTVGSLAPGASTPVSIAFTTSGSAPQGTYAVRTALSFLANGTEYLFESRGWFSTSVWNNATTLPGGASTLNLTRLGVSGVVPETGVLVRSNPIAPWLYALVVGALILAAVGGYYATRDGPGSSSGARPVPPESNAPSALGNRRTRDGD